MSVAAKKACNVAPTYEIRNPRKHSGTGKQRNRAAAKQIEQRNQTLTGARYAARHDWIGTHGRRHGETPHEGRSAMYRVRRATGGSGKAETGRGRGCNL